MSGEQTVGSIVGFLRLEADQFHREIERALVEVKALDGKNVNIDVKTDKSAVKSIEQDLLRVSKAAQGVEGNVGAMGDSFKGLRDPRVIVGAIGAGMALLGPVTGAATAAMAGFVGVAGTAVLAFIGFQQEVKSGTALGHVMQGQIAGLKAEFMTLGATASHAMAGDVLSAMSEIRRFLPSLNDGVGSLAGHLGHAFSIGTHGLIGALQTMMPLLEDGGRYAELMATKFADFAESQTFKDFVDYARRELPNVGSAIMQLADGLGSMAVALAPVGDDLIAIIGLMGKLSKAAAPVVGILTKISQLPILGSGLHSLSMANEAIDKLTNSNKDAAKAVGEHTSYLLTLQQVQSSTATALGTTDDALNKARDAHRQNAQAAAATTLQMQLENNAAGLLKQSLDALNGTNLSAAQAQNTFDSALSNMGNHITKTGKKVEFTTTSINNMSTASVALRGQLLGQVTAAEATAEAYGQMKGSSEAGRVKLVALRKQIIDNAVAHGVDRKAVESYIDKVLKVPKKVPPTKLQVDTRAALTGIAAFQRAIDSLHGKSVGVTTHYAYTGKLPGGGTSTHGGSTFADGGVIGSVPGYAGGTLIGPGSGTSDSIMAMVAQTREMVRLSNGEFISTASSQKRNRAALEAGNKGATLAVADGGGVTELGDSTIARLAAAVSRIQLQAVLSAGQLDAAIGATL